MAQHQPLDHDILEDIAKAVIRQLQRLPEIQNDRIIIIGGLAMQHHLTDNRDTEDIDFLITTKGGPQYLKAKLLALPDTPFHEKAWKLMYLCPITLKEIFIDFWSEQEFPFTPREVRIIGQTNTETLPYISLGDLLAFKTYSCGLRPDPTSADRDARDIMLLLHVAEKPIRLTAQQRVILVKHKEDVMACRSGDPNVWRNCLGM